MTPTRDKYEQVDPEKDLIRIPGTPGGSTAGFEGQIGPLMEREGGFVAKDGRSGAPANFGINQKYNPDVDVSKLTPEDARIDWSLPAAAVLGPMLFSAALHMTGVTDAKPPVELIAAAQVVVGTTIGCRFAGVKMALVARSIVASIGSTVILVASGLTMVTGVLGATAQFEVRRILSLLSAISWTSCRMKSGTKSSRPSGGVFRVRRRSPGMDCAGGTGNSADQRSAA